MTSKIDFHTHSTASDGTLTPRELAFCAAENGVGVIALTDHDTVSGVDEFLKACADAGITGVAGVEISAESDVRTHIVGLFVDYKNERFISDLKALSASRADRNYRMLKLCRENGMDITEDDLLSQKADGSMSDMGRPHFANVMVKKGYASDKNDAFERFLKRGRPCYSSRLAYSPRKCIDMIHQAGGVAVLAHPIYISRDWDGLYPIVSELKACGLDAMECYYSEYTKEYSRMCLKMCGEIGLLPSGGSDFHGANKPEIAIGVVNGGESVPYGVYESLEELRRERVIKNG